MSHIRKLRRALISEQLENRCLMAADLSHNFILPHDVNDDSRVSPVDALLLINRLNASRSADDSAVSNSTIEFEDVNDDSRLSPVDALLVINQLNSNSSQSTVDNSASTSASHLESRIDSSTSSAVARIEFESNGSESELNIKLRDAAANTSYSVSLNDIALGELVTDSKGRGRLDFGQGDDNDHRAPLPDGLTLSANLELIIGDIIRGSTSSSNPNSSSSSSSGDDSSSNNSSGDDSSSDDSSADSSSSSSSASSSSSHLIAVLPREGSLRRSAEYESETERSLTKSKLKIEIEGAAANATFAVSIDGRSIGEVTTDSRGRAKMTWSTAPRSGELTLPTTLSINVGSSINMGDAAAQLIVGSDD